MSIQIIAWTGGSAPQTIERNLSPRAWPGQSVVPRTGFHLAGILEGNLSFGRMPDILGPRPLRRALNPKTELIQCQPPPNLT